MIYRASPAGLVLVRREEGCKLKPYKDWYGYLTVGVGHRIRPGEDFSQGITEGKADSLLAADIGECESTLTNACGDASLPQQCVDALLSWLFNCGAHAIDKSQIRTAIKGGRASDVPRLLEAWCHGPGGVVDPILLARRRREGAYFAAGLDTAHTVPDVSVPPRAELTDEEREHIMALVSLSLFDLSTDVVEDMEQEYQRNRDPLAE